MAKKFVCVRVQSMNGVNLEQFPFEYDLTWMSFFQNDAGQTYARYGGRDDTGSESHLNRESLISTMQTVLELHKTNAVQKPSRYEPEATSATLPSDLPLMKQMIGKRKETCIHCHDVKVARLRHQHELGTIEKNMVFTYPSPAKLGFTIDPKQHELVSEVTSKSAADDAGLQSGDKLLASDGQRIVTYADLTRVLELAPTTGKLPLEIERNGTPLEVEVPLPEGWRISDDPSWRASLHTVGPGAGFWGRPANSKERQQLKVGPEDLALKITFIWAPHAKAAKVRNGDFVIDLDGHRSNMNMRQFHGFLHLNRNWGDEIKLTAIRGGKEIELDMKLPSEPPHE